MDKPINKVCNVCGSAGSETAPLKKCGKCRAVSYCTVEHQREDWQNHKPNCKPSPNSKPASTPTSVKPKQPEPKQNSRGKQSQTQNHSGSQKGHPHGCGDPNCGGCTGTLKPSSHCPPGEANTPKKALYSEVDPKGVPDILPAIRLVEQAHKLTFSFDEEGAWVTFPTLGAAKNWVTQHLKAYPGDRGVCIGRDQDSLIRYYSEFRVNESFYHLIQYILEKDLIYNPTTKMWNNKITNPKTRLWADQMLRIYNLL